MIAVASVEPKYGTLIGALSLPEFQDAQFVHERWGALRRAMARRFAGQPLSHWVALFDACDACVSSVVSRLGTCGLSDALRFDCPPAPGS